MIYWKPGTRDDIKYTYKAKARPYEGLKMVIRFKPYPKRDYAKKKKESKKNQKIWKLN